MNKKNAPVIILIVSLVGLSFVTGFLWSKVQALQKGDSKVAVNQPTPTTPPAGDPDPVTKEDWIKGSMDAKVILIEYSDLECPYCKQFHQTVMTVMKDYNDSQVAWVYRHFPLEQLHPKAPTEAIAAECVGKLGGNNAFWTFIDTIFEETPSNNGLDLALLPDYAGKAGVNVKSFQSCLDAKEAEDLVNADFSSGQTAGVRGTPGSFLVNTASNQTQYIPGAIPAAQLKQQIDALLK